MQQGDGPDAMGKLFNNNERSDRQMKMPQRHGGRLSKPASTGSLPNSGIDRNPKAERQFHTLCAANSDPSILPRVSKPSPCYEVTGVFVRLTASQSH